MLYVEIEQLVISCWCEARTSQHLNNRLKHCGQSAQNSSVSDAQADNQ